MKKLLFISLLVIVIISAMVLTGCGDSDTTTTSAPTSAAPTSSAPTSAAPTTSTGPQYGGVLRIVAAGIPAVLGYPPEFAPSDSIGMLHVLERLCEWDEQGNQIPVLAESWDVDVEAKTLTWHLRKGVKFHDGTDFNAEAARWNYQLSIDNMRLTDGQFVESLEVVDEYTLTMHLTEFNWMMVENYGWNVMISPTAFENAGEGDIEKSKEWARLNAVGTGAFKVSDFQRDTHIKFVRNDNYWREGMPYLDGIEVYQIMDPLVAAAKLEAGEADMWAEASTPEDILDLQEKGFKLNWGPGMFFTLLPNSADPESIFYDKNIREAVEYAIDKEALANMLGSGLYEPLHQMASSTWPGYVEGYDPRPYNLDMARQKLADAGHPDGFTTTIMATDTGRDAVAAMQSFLGEVGIIVEPDIADLGRYFGAVFGTGWDDLVFTASGINPDGTDLFVHYGPNPMTFRTGNIYKSPEYLALCNEALDTKYASAADAMSKIKEAIRQGGEDAVIIPLYRTAAACIMTDKVHSDYLTIHGVIWTSYNDWIEQD